MFLIYDRSERRVFAMLEKGFVHVYTGDGKGKTTAAIGLAVRAAGAGLRTYFAQFVKGMEYSELRALKLMSDLITIKQYGLGCFITREPTEKDIRAARDGLRETMEIMLLEKHDIVVLDEANIAVLYNLFPVEDLLELIRLKPEKTELLITGRRADPRIIEAADLVTEMVEVKHYYRKGVLARDGIER